MSWQPYHSNTLDTKYKDYKEKRARFDPIEWSKCNICKEKYPNDEIIQHIHQKHPDKD